jgi:hypothetical protein
MRTALAGAALIEEHDVVALRIEEAPHLRIGTAARAAVQEDSGFAARVAAFLVIDFVAVGDAEVAAVVRLDGGIKRA